MLWVASRTSLKMQTAVVKVRSAFQFLEDTEKARFTFKLILQNSLQLNICNIIYVNVVLCPI